MTPKGHSILRVRRINTGNGAAEAAEIEPMAVLSTESESMEGGAIQQQ